MGHSYSKPEDHLRSIVREVNSLKSSLRTCRQNISKERKKNILETLANQSGEVHSMRGKVKGKHIQEALRNISETMAEVQKIEPSELDEGTVESDSFVNLPLREVSSRSLGSQGSSSHNLNSQASNNGSTVLTLRNIEEKVNAIKSQINNAIDNNDSKQLEAFLKDLDSLETDLKLNHTKSDISLEKRKQSVSKKIMSLHNKVSMELNEMKTYENSQNQNKLQRKIKSMADLSAIELNLKKNKSLLDRSIKEKNPVDVAAIRNNIMENNQKLANIDLVDNEVNEKAAFLSQEITETVNTLDGVMAKREFDSKFAKSLETFERIVQNIDSSRNADDTVNQLERLQNSMENLEEINDITKNHKEQLLADIKCQINKINETMQKESDEKIVKKIVEDNVILRKNVRSMDAEYTIIDQFNNYWYNVRSNFDINCYSIKSLLRIDRILGQMEQSIYDLRIDIANKCDTNIPATLNSKLSQSTPKLNNTKSYGSNRSLNQLDGKSIQARPKTKNISTSDLVNVDNQYQYSGFSKIEDIKQQVFYIKEKIEESQNNNTLRHKLELYLKYLNTFFNDSNKNVAIRAVQVSNEIKELLHKIYLAEIKEQIHVLLKRVQSFNGTISDKEFDEVMNDLVQVQLNLEHFNIPAQYDLLIREKGVLIEKVCSTIDLLQEKGPHHKKYAGEYEKHVKSELLVLTQKVNRFSGTYKDALYNSIERQLTRLIVDAGEHVEEVWSDEISKEAEKLLKILKQRSYLVQSFKVNSEERESDERVGMIKMGRELLNIRKQIDQTPDNNVDDLVSLQSRLDLVKLEISQITARSNENLAKEKENCINEVEILENVVNAKVALRQKPVHHWPERQLQLDLPSFPKNDAHAEIEQIEHSFMIILEEIAAPTDEEDVHKYYKLAQDIKNLMEKLRRHTFPTGTDMHNKQLDTLREMQHHVEVLEKKAVDVNYVLNMEKKIDQLKSLFESEQKYDLQAMAKELQDIQKKLQEHHLNSSSEMWRTRKTSVQQTTDDLTQKLKTLEYIRSQKQTEETRKIEDFERKVRSIAPEILSFSGLKSDDKFYELNETTIRMIIELDKVLDKVTHAELHKRIIKLLKELHSLGETLDGRAQQAQDLDNAEQELDNISTMISSSSNINEEINGIKVKMEIVQSQLQRLEVPEQLAPRKNACIAKISALYNKLVALDNSLTAESEINATTTKQSIHSCQITNDVVDSKYDINEHDIFTSIARNLEGITTDVNTTNDKNQLQTIHNALAKYTAALINIKYQKDSPQFSIALELYRKIQNVVPLIEQKIQDTDRLNGISHRIVHISNEMNNALTSEQINQLHDELIRLQQSLSKVDSAALTKEKDACSMQIILYLGKIMDHRRTIESTHV